jgi:hypothetical protein
MIPVNRHLLRYTNGASWMPDSHRPRRSVADPPASSADGSRPQGGEFHAPVEYLVATLDQFGVPEAEKNELLGALAPMRADIIEVESSAAGTPLPDGYRNAPPLAGAIGS